MTGTLVRASGSATIGGLSLMRPVGGGLWNSRFFHADGIGSIRRLTNEAGTITDGYSHTAFGERVAQTGTDPQPYSFAGESLDPTTELSYHRARWLQAGVGRFLGMDPAPSGGMTPQSLNRYVYAFNSPIALKDASGLWPTWIHNRILDEALKTELKSWDISELKSPAGSLDSRSASPVCP